MKFLPKYRLRLPVVMALSAVFVSAQVASAATIFASFDSRSETDGDPGPTNATISDLAIGPVSAGRSFRSYLTFDLSTAPVVNAGGSVGLELQDTSSTGNPNESNTSSLAQNFILFEVASDWDGAAAPGPEGTTLASVGVTPSTGNHAGNLIFSGPDLVNAYNAAVGGNLYLGIKSDQENADARSFVWYGSIEDGAGNQPSLSVVIPEPSTAILGGLGLLALLRRRR